MTRRVGVFPGHLLWRVGFVEITKSPNFERFGEWLAGRFRVLAGLRGTGPTRGFSIGLPMNGLLVWVWERQSSRCSVAHEKVPGRSLAPVDVRVLDASRFFLLEE